MFYRLLLNFQFIESFGTEVEIIDYDNDAFPACILGVFHIVEHIAKPSRLEGTRHYGMSFRLSTSGSYQCGTSSS